jgi:hypothetical protein
LGDGEISGADVVIATIFPNAVDIVVVHFADLFEFGLGVEWICEIVLIDQDTQSDEEGENNENDDKFDEGEGGSHDVNRP